MTFDATSFLLNRATLLMNSSFDGGRRRDRRRRPFCILYNLGGDMQVLICGIILLVNFNFNSPPSARRTLRVSSYSSTSRCRVHLHLRGRDSAMSRRSRAADSHMSVEKEQPTATCPSKKSSRQRHVRRKRAADSDMSVEKKLPTATCPSKKSCRQRHVRRKKVADSDMSVEKEQPTATCPSHSADSPAYAEILFLSPSAWGSRVVGSPITAYLNIEVP